MSDFTQCVMQRPIFEITLKLQEFDLSSTAIALMRNFVLCDSL